MSVEIKNSAWLEWAAVADELRAELVAMSAGSASAPGLPFTNDADTGVYRVGANELGVATGGSNRVTVSSAGLNATNLLRAGSQVFSRDNIVGTVTQSAGVPTGAIVERGDNGSGNYVKYADGTQICFGALDMGSRISQGSGTYADPFSVDPINLTFPAAFTGPPSVSFGVRVNSTENARRAMTVTYRLESAAGTTLTDIQAFATGGDSTTAAVFVKWIAVGRWY